MHHGTSRAIEAQSEDTKSGARLLLGDITAPAAVDVVAVAGYGDFPQRKNLTTRSSRPRKMSNRSITGQQCILGVYRKILFWNQNFSAITFTAFLNLVRPDLFRPILFSLVLVRPVSLSKR